MGSHTKFQYSFFFVFQFCFLLWFKLTIWSFFFWYLDKSKFFIWITLKLFSFLNVVLLFWRKVLPKTPLVYNRFKPPFLTNPTGLLQGELSTNDSLISRHVGTLPMRDQHFRGCTLVRYVTCFEEDESAAIPLAEADTARVRPDILKKIKVKNRWYQGPGGDIVVETGFWGDIWEYFSYEICYTREIYIFIFNTLVY